MEVMFKNVRAIGNPEKIQKSVKKNTTATIMKQVDVEMDPPIL